MNTNRQIPWPRIFAEGAAIVVSILLAFWIDAWWDEKRDRVKAKQAFQTVLAEFKVNRNRLGEDSSRHRKILAAAKELLEVSSSEAPVDAAQLESLLFTVFVDSVVFDPSHGAVSSLLASGQLDLARNAELRSLLIDWSGNLADLAVDEKFIIEDVQRRLTPFLIDSIPMRNIIRTHKGSSDIPPLDSPLGYSSLLKNMEFDNFVSYRILSERYAINESELVLSKIDRIIALVETELEMWE